MKWVMCLLFQLGLWIPSSFKNKILVVSSLDINFYKYRFSVTTASVNIADAVSRITAILEIDLDKGYAIGNNTVLPYKSDKLFYKWCCDNNNVMVDVSVLRTWLELITILYTRYEVGIKLPKHSKAYRNSVKLSPLIDEADEILSNILENHKYTTTYD